MREGLRSSTVSQRRRDLVGSRRVAKRVSDGGLVGDLTTKKNILPDLNCEAKPSELAADGNGVVEKGLPCERGDAGDGCECKGILAENGVEGCPAHESIKLKGVDTEVKSEVEEDLVHTCLPVEECEQEFDGKLENMRHEKDEDDCVKTVDFIMEGSECNGLECNNVCAVEEEMVADKDKTKAVDGLLQPRVVANHRCDGNIATYDSCIEPKVEKHNEDSTAEAGNSDLQSTPAALGGCSENFACSLDRVGGRLDSIGHSRNALKEDKLHTVGKVLRSRVVAVNIEVHVSGKRKSATGCHVNETEVMKDDQSNVNLKSHNKKRKGIRGRPKEKGKEDSLQTCVLQDEEVSAEELKNDESNGSFDGKRKKHKECWESSIVKVEEEASMLIKDDSTAKVLSNDVSKELVVGRNKKCKVGQGRGRPRKKHKENISGNCQLGNDEAASEHMVKIKQNESNELINGTDKQQKLRHGRFKRRGRGRPRKIEKENVEDSKNPRGKDEENTSANGTNKQQHFSLQRFKKCRPGRPRKINKENDAEKTVLLDQEGTLKAEMTNQDSNDFLEGSMKQVSNELVGDTQLDRKIKVSGTSSPSSSSRLKRKRENNGKQPSKSQSNLSSKCNRKVKSSTREEKNLVREQIVDMLKRAGWSVEYRPRNGKEYSDAVYVNPDGRAHWSVTLAYRMLKRDVENGKMQNFCFTPIPEEKLGSLFRIQMKSRSDKNKPRDKVSCVKFGGKSRGKKKRGYVCDREEKTVSSPSKGKALSVRSGKQNRRRCALLVRGSGQGLCAETEEFMAVYGKHSILSWMIESGVIPPGGKVHCRRRTKVLLEGSITRDGIHCSCCSKLHSVAQFEVHAGNKLCQTYQNLYLDNGSSLLQCQLESWNKQEESVRLGFHNVNIDDNDPNDDTCGICGDGGNLICCDSCPSTFHQTCLDIQKFPSGDWHCIYCSCKYCGEAGGDVDQVDEKHDKFPSMLTCFMCDGKYHRFCAEEKDAFYGQSSSSSFCGKSCEQIYERFQGIVGVRAEVGDGHTCTLIKRTDISPKADALEPTEVENLSKLAVALSVMDECFLPIIDHRSGINIMRHTLYSCGSNFKRLNFRGFFTAILEHEDEIISAASIRIHGKELAEMPFIGTRNAYRRQGMCRRLLNGIESALRSLAIEKLVIPAVSEVSERWTSVFGFEPLGELGSDMRYMNIIVFPGVDMLQKPLLGQQVAGETTYGQDEKDVKPADSGRKNPAEQNGLDETKAHDDCLSENSDPSTKALQVAELSSDNGCQAHLESAAVDQDGSKSAIICSATTHSTDEANLSTLEPSAISGHFISSSEEPILEADLSSVGDDACEKDIKDPSKSLTASDRAVFEDPESRSGEGKPDDSIRKGFDVAADKMNRCNDQNPANDVKFQSNCLIASPKLEVQLVDPSENGTMELSSDSLGNCNLPSNVSDSNDKDILVEELHASTRPASSRTSSKVVEIKFHEMKEKSSAFEGNKLFIQDSSLPNVAQLTAKSPEQFESDVQIDCKIVTPFKLEKSCNMGSGSSDFGPPVGFHACGAPEVGSK